jgi:archaemetzincin
MTFAYTSKHFISHRRELGLRDIGVFLLDPFERKMLECILLRVSEAGLLANFAGEAHCETGFDRLRQQWRADLVLSDCMKRGIQEGAYHLSLVLTERDIFLESMNFVFGLASRDLRAAIVSWHRLKNSDYSSVFVDRLAKEIVHEVGHLKGLEHCLNQRCVMWFSNTLQETDNKGLNFCQSCAKWIMK